MDKDQNISKLSLGFLILMFSYISFSNTFFSHTHTLADGMIVVHSHVHNGESSDPETGHHHSAAQFELIQSLNLLLNFAILIVFSFHVFSSRFLFISKKKLLLKQSVESYIKGRAPPSQIVVTG